jgi:putative holliday junction resolvase
MPGLVPGIHVFLIKQGVDGRDKPGHDAAERQQHKYESSPSRMTAPVLPLVDIAPLLPARGALIGLDLGTKTIGVAASDPDRHLATGVETVARKTFTADAARLLALAAERKAAGFVLGLPINMDGSEGPRAQSTRAFARNLARLTELPIGLWDERLSTVAVERDLIEADVSRKKRAEVIDQHAAAFILQGALDRLARLSG